MNERAIILRGFSSSLGDSEDGEMIGDRGSAHSPFELFIVPALKSVNQKLRN